MKNKDRFNLAHIEWYIDRWCGMLKGKNVSRITLIHENMPIISFTTEKLPFKAILEWLEEDLEDY